MELIILIAALHMLFNGIFHLSVCCKRQLLPVFAVLGGAFCYMVYPIAIEQNKISMGNLLMDQSFINNLTLVYIFEGLFAALLSFHLLQSLFNPKKDNLLHKTKWFPGIMLFAALFYLEVLFFFNVHAFEFNTLAIFFSIAVAAFIGLMPLVIQRLIPEEGLRLELKFIFGISGVLLAVILKASPGLSSPFHYSYPWDMEQMTMIIGGMLIMSIPGLLWGKYKLKRIKK